MCIKVLVINIILIITLYINAYQTEYVLSKILYESFSSAAATIQQEPARGILYISYRASCKGKVLVDHNQTNISRLKQLLRSQ